MTVKIETTRLTLREASPSDAPFILELMNERGYLENIGDRGVRTVRDAESYLAAKYTTNYQNLGYGLYVVETKEPKVAVGICGFVKRDSLEHPDVGFAYLERYQARGYGYESAAAVLDFGQTTLGFSRILGVTSQTNLRSIRLLEKLGLTYERLISLPGYASESSLYSRALSPIDQPVTMPTSKEEICHKYGMTPDEYDVVVALALRPTCENCNKSLPPDSLDARICSFECTFCATCVSDVIGNVCPNCGGGFTNRPIRPSKNWKGNNYLGAYPARQTIKHKPVVAAVHQTFSAPIRKLPSELR